MTALAGRRRGCSARRADRWDVPSLRSETPPAWSIVRRERTGCVKAAMREAGGGPRGGTVKDRTPHGSHGQPPNSRPAHRRPQVLDRVAERPTGERTVELVGERAGEPRLEELHNGVHGHLRLVGIDAGLLGHEVDERVHGVGPGLGTVRSFNKSRISVRSLTSSGGGFGASGGGGP